jgi:hypothetical protein
VNKTERKINFDKFTRDLLVLPVAEIGADKQALAKRYRNTRRRLNVLERGMRLAHRAVRVQAGPTYEGAQTLAGRSCNSIRR